MIQQNQPKGRLWIIFIFDMFLTKKNAKYFNKPKTIDPSKPKRALAGWGDETETDEQPDYSSKAEIKAQGPSSNLLESEGLETAVQEVTAQKEKFYFNWDDLDERTDIECEKKIIEEIVQLGGIRIKPSDTMLGDFDKEVRGMDVAVIGSLLLSKVEVNYPFQVKAKALYTMEHLIRKNKGYLSYFEAHREKLAEFPEPEDNVENYRKILKNVLSAIGVVAVKAVTEQPQPVYVNPWQNEELVSGQVKKEKKEKKESKRAIIGPGQKKVEPVGDSIDLMGLDLLAPQKKGEVNLLDGPFVASKPVELTFEQLLGNVGRPNVFHL